MLSLFAELLLLVLLAVSVSRLAPQPWKGRLLNALKAWFTVRCFWLLLAHEVRLEDGSHATIWSLVVEMAGQVSLGTFLLFCGLAAGIKFIGILASMYRWRLLLEGQRIELPFRHIFGSFLIGRFIGTFLPSTAGLDGYKLYDAARFSGRTVEVTATTALEKVIGFSGIFLSFLVALPFGIKIFGENAGLIAVLTIPFCIGIIGALLVVLWYPAVFQWILEKLPIPGKARLEGLVMRVSHSAAAYRDKKPIVVAAFGLSFIVHFTTAAMYYFTALAIGASAAEFWPIAFGSSIQILATVLSPFTIAGEGIREAAQYAVLGNMIGPANAIVSAGLGFWAAEALTLAGAYFWWFRPADYKPEYCLVEGQQVDYEEAAKAALSLETEQERARREAAPAAELPPLLVRARASAALGLGAGVVAGALVGLAEAIVIGAAGLGGEAQVFWYGPLAYAAVLGGLGLGGGVALSVLPMDLDEIRGWTPSLALIGTLVPMGLFITVFRVRRDVFAEQMPPLPVLLGILAGFGLLALVLFLVGPRLFRSSFGVIARPLAALGVLGVAVAGGAVYGSTLVEAQAAPEPRTAVPAALRDRPNLILVMVDTLRADHLSCYGGQQVATPNLCRVATDGGSVFDGFAHASWTKPSAATLVTSLVPSSHGVMSKPSALSDDVTLVAEALQEHGYATGGIVSNTNLAPSYGFAQGSDEYHYLAPDYLFGAGESSSKLIVYQLARRVWFRLKPGLRFGDFYQAAEVVNEVAFDFFERHKDDRFFLFLHYMDPHDPYFEHPWNGKGFDRATNQHPDPELASSMHELYLGEIAYLDDHFGRMLERLEELGLYDDTVIVVVSDHGEEFQEHGGWWHGFTLYEEQIRVPLLVKWPKGQQLAKPDARGPVAGLIDVAPTLLARAGAPVPPEMQGVDLALDPAARPPQNRVVFSEENHEGNELRSLRTADWKLIEVVQGDLPPVELFHVGRDPGETQNVAEAQAAKLADLRKEAQAQETYAKTHAKEATEAQLSSAEEDALRQLGYIE